jgi:hypothetical protein
MPEPLLQQTMRGIESKSIEYVIIYGLDASGTAYIEFVLHIDWERHALHIGNGRRTVKIDQRWPGGAAPEVVAMTKLFNDYVESNGLRVQCRVTYREGLDRDAVNRELGGTRVKPVRWAGDRSPWKSAIDELDELVLELYLMT